MKKGTELITDEREKQLTKLDRTIVNDVKNNGGQQLRCGAMRLISRSNKEDCPIGWDVDHWNKMRNKPYKERLIIAGALIAAEIDRIQSISQAEG